MMKLSYQLVCFLLFAITLFSMPTHTEATSTTERTIALHDRILLFEKEEVKMVNGRMVVPFVKMARYLYADIVLTSESITVTKNDTSFSYNYATAETTVNQLVIQENRIQLIDDVLYIPLRFFGESTGFTVDYLSTILTARLTRDAYPHLSNDEFIQKIRDSRKPVPVPTPTPIPVPVPVPVPVPSPPTDQPIVYLTFDDGPNRYTSDHLRILKEYNIKGTFFFVGNQILSYKPLTLQTYKEGHYLGLHSMTHNREKVYASPKAFMGEMTKESDLIKSITGHTSTLVRTPYGSSPHVTPAMRGMLKSGGFKLWDWDVDTVDWNIDPANFQQIITNVKNGVEKARRAKDKHIVVLLHDRVQTTKALPGIITWLQQQGYSIQPYTPDLHVTQNFWHDQHL